MTQEAETGRSEGDLTVQEALAQLRTLAHKREAVAGAVDDAVAAARAAGATIPEIVEAGPYSELTVRRRLGLPDPPSRRTS